MCASGQKITVYLAGLGLFSSDCYCHYTYMYGCWVSEAVTKVAAGHGGHKRV
jgi:hypothetical protein